MRIPVRTPSLAMIVTPFKRALLWLLVPTMLALPTLGAAEPRTYHIDPAHFSVSFSVDHVDYADVIGLFLEAEGEFVYDEQRQTLTSGSATIQADSVFTNHQRRDEHVKDDDFLDVDRYPTIEFVADELTEVEDNRGTLTGNLTLLGETRPVTLDVQLNKADRYPFGHEKYTLGISATTELNRSEWGMDYAVDNGLVGDTVAVRLEFEAIRQPE